MDGSITRMNPFRSPRWRCDRVLHLLQTPGWRFRHFDGEDYPVRAYHRFLSWGAAARQNGRKFSDLCNKYPHVAQAHSLHYSPSPESQQILQARLLTTETFEQIAVRTNTEAPVVELYGQLFFDVRERMQASDWIMKVILGRASERAFTKKGVMTDEQRGFLYRLFAYYGGPMVLDAMITGIGNVSLPQRPSDVANWFDNALRGIVQTRAAAAARLFDLNRQNVIQVMKLALPRSKTSARRREVAEDSDISNQRMAKVMEEILQATRCDGPPRPSAKPCESSQSPQ